MVYVCLLYPELWRVPDQPDLLWRAGYPCSDRQQWPQVHAETDRASLPIPPHEAPPPPVLQQQGILCRIYAWW